MEKKPRNYIIDVIPLIRIPLSRQQYFSYEFERKLSAGTLVNIPLFRRFLNGIVINSRDDFHRLGNIKLKKVASIIEENFLTPEQLELAKFISDYYICPLGIVLKFFIPKLVNSRRSQLATQPAKRKNIILTEQQKTAVKKIVTSSELRVMRFLLFGPASSGKTEVYIKTISKFKIQSSKFQFLVLLPELTLTPQAVERYGTIFKPEEIAVIHSKIPKGELYRNWQKIKLGKARIIIGTRMAVFAPFKNLKLTVIDEEQDISFKQWDMNPRYDARTVAEKLAEIHKAKIVRGSATPGVESYYKAQNNGYKLLELPHLEIPNLKSQIPNKFKIQNSKFKILPPAAEIVDMRNERWVKNYSPISKALKAEVEYALKNKLQTILFINHQGMSAFSICGNCRTVLKCSGCDRALVYENSGIYKCPRCSYKTGVLITCTKCKGIIFRNIGLGTQKVEKEINKLFPSAKIKRVDFEAMKKIKDAENLYHEFNRADFDILIGTQMITKGWDNPKVGLVGIIDADNLLAIADFKTDEKAYQLIVQIAGRTARPGSAFPGKVVIQTFNPENFIIKTAAKMDYGEFYQKEIEERKALNYPPFSRLIRLIYQNYNQKKVENEAKKLYNEIGAKFRNTKDFSVSGHQEPLVSKVRGRFKKQIIIKFQKDIPAEIRKLLERLGSEWIIDIDPINTI